MEWRDIKNFEGKYQISNTGLVKSLSRKVSCHKDSFRTIKEKMLSNKIDKYGYASYSLSGENRKGKYFTAHRLVAMAFIPNPENKPQVNHLDGNKLNNSIENLEWCTASENIKHAFSVGVKTQKGSNNNASKLKEEDVEQIRFLHNEILKELAETYNVSTACIRDLIKNRRWKQQ